MDLRDLYRRGSGLTLRRLGVLIRNLPSDAALWDEVRGAQERAESDRKVSKLEDRQNSYQRRGGAA